MPPLKKIVRLGERYSQLKQMRSGHEATLQEAQTYVTPNRADFKSAGGHTSTRNQDNSKMLYDHTAVRANQMFANGMCSYLMPKSNNWAYLKPEAKPSADLTSEELIFLEQLSNKVMHILALPSCQFYSAGHEAFHDLGSFGTSVTYVDRTGPIITFKSCALADTFFDVNEVGKVDTLYHRKFMTTKALIQMFPEVVNVKGFDPETTDTKHELVYAVEPSQDIRAQRHGKVGTARPYQATFYLPALDAILKEGGLTYFPYLVPRWMVVAGEIWGRGPAYSCMPAIRVLNKMVKELLKSAELANAPTLSAEEDSLLLPISYGARSIIYREQGTPIPEPIMSGSQPQITLELLRDYREQIQMSFFTDQIIRDQKKERQSIVEIQDERSQMLQQIGPLLARMETEFLAPVIEHVIEWMQSKDGIFDFGQMPESLSDSSLEIVFTSPAAHAQYATGVGNLSGLLQDLTPLVSVKPEIMDAINDVELVDQLTRMRNVSRKVVAPKKEVEDSREARNQQEQQNQQIEQLPNIAGAMKDVAKARSDDPEGLGQLLNI